MASLPGTPFLFYLSLFLVTGSALGFEILLLRFFSLSYGHHFASSIISMALLGIGAAGIFLQLARNRLMSHFRAAYILSAGLLGIFMILSIVCIRLLPFNPREITWSIAQWYYLALNYLIYALPFFFSGLCVSLAMSVGRFPLGHLYRADLLGAGLGGLAVIAGLFFMEPHQLLKALSLGPLAAACAAALFLMDSRRFLIIALLGLVMFGIFIIPQERLKSDLSQYKELTNLMFLPDTEVLTSKTSPLGRLEIVRSPANPIRIAPGLSPLCPHPVPGQIGIFVDGDLHGALPAEPPEGPSYLDCLPTALPFELMDQPHVFIGNIFSAPELLLLSRAAGTPVLEGSYDYFELPAMVDRIFSGRETLYSGKGIRLEQGLTRAALSRQKDRYNLVAFWLRGSGGGSLGVTPVREQFDLTVQGFEIIFESLKDNGIMMASLWRHRPPYETLKLLATLREADNDADITRQLVVVATPSTVTVFYKKSPWASEEIATVRSMARTWSFETPYLPPPFNAEITDNSLARDIKAIIGPRARTFMSGYKFHLEPPTDDRPFFNRYFTWKSVPELAGLREHGGGALLQWSYLMQIATLLLAVAAGTLLMLMPLILFRKQEVLSRGRIRLFLYFSALGLAFLFVELTLIHLFSLFLGHPFFSASIVLVAFLCWAGLGSGFSNLFNLRTILAAIMTILVLYLVFLPETLSSLSFLPLAFKTVLTVLICLPPAFFMGMPFPKGLDAVSSVHSKSIPWAWGINGVASVISPLLAHVLAIHFGFRTILGLTVFFYGLALISGPIRSGLRSME